jgi:AcrR family transcriptional regulator
MAEAAPGYRRDRPRLPGAERRRQILKMTRGLVAERGFWGLSMQDVADRCGLTVPGVLHHFGSKVGLLISVLEELDAEDVQALAAQLGRTAYEVGDGFADGTGRIGLREWCSAMMRRSAAQPDIVRLYAVLEAESLEPSHPAHVFFLGRRQQALGRLALLTKDHTDQPESLARQVLAMMDGLQVRWLRDPSVIDLVQEWESAADMLFGPVGGRTEPPTRDHLRGPRLGRPRQR